MSPYRHGLFPWKHCLQKKALGIAGLVCCELVGVGGGDGGFGLFPCRTKSDDIGIGIFWTEREVDGKRELQKHWL